MTDVRRATGRRAETETPRTAETPTKCSTRRRKIHCTRAADETSAMQSRGMERVMEGGGDVSWFGELVVADGSCGVLGTGSRSGALSSERPSAATGWGLIGEAGAKKSCPIDNSLDQNQSPATTARKSRRRRSGLPGVAKDCEVTGRISGDVWVLRRTKKRPALGPVLVSLLGAGWRGCRLLHPKIWASVRQWGVESGGKREKRRWILGTDQAEGTPPGLGRQRSMPLGSSHPKRVPPSAVSVPEAGGLLKSHWLGTVTCSLAETGN